MNPNIPPGQGAYLPSAQHPPSTERNAVFYPTGAYDPTLPYTQEAYTANRNAIPGLVLGFSAPSEWSQSWHSATSSGDAHASSIALNNPTQNTEHSIQRQANDGQLLESDSGEVSGEKAWGTVEEGELEDVGLEDLYEPAEAASHTQSGAVSNDIAPESSKSSAANGMVPDPADNCSVTSPDADRSGSYSPFLSPHEASTKGEMVDDIQPQQQPILTGSGAGTSASQQTNASTPSHMIMDTVAEGHGPNESSRDILVRKKKEAEDSILRLWPLNVRYQTYLDEGIDGALLQTLFTDINLDVSASPTPPVSERAAPKSTNIVSATSNTVAVPIKGANDSSAEARKDKIARLLAAKGSKQVATSSESPGPGTGTPATPGQLAAPKVLSEKSKLIQQKMEALKKARQAQGQRSASQPKQADEVKAGPAEVGASTTPHPGTISRSEAPTQVELPGKDDIQAPIIESTSSIPGLALTPNPKPAQSHKRPVASDLNDTADISAKRPFGQPRKAQPFLIDVSDDEDDAAMDIDSPEERPATLDKPKSPFKIPAYRDLQASTNNFSPRPVSTPNPTTTPPLPPSEDLASMQKTIDDMKRRIAEAEARKKSRQSRPSSPSIEPTPKLVPIIPKSATSTPRRETSRASSSNAGDARPTASPQPLGSESYKLPKLSEHKKVAGDSLKPSRSRIASERLPEVERNRRTQQLKLQALQSQMLRIQKEIEAGMAEEERLRAEAAEAAEATPEEDENKSTSSTSSISNPQQEIEEPLEPQALDGPPQPEMVAVSDETGSATEQVAPKSHTHSPAKSAVATSGTGVTELTAVPTDAADERVPPDESKPASSLPLEPANGVLGLTDDREDQVLHSPSERHINSQVFPIAETIGPAAGGEEDGTSQDDFQSTEQSSSRLSEPGSDGGDGDILIDASDDGEPAAAKPAPITQTISGDQKAMTPEPCGEDQFVRPKASTNDSRTNFIPYESPLLYFRAYRFHPNFSASVPGGLRSLTYSNKIDVKKELCPDQLTGGQCPKGNQCEFQHFESIQAPDDQILLQLGGYGNYEGQNRQDFNDGLRQLLTDYRNRKIRDFQTISQGIIEYRTKFRGDGSKILPLGDVSI